MFPPSALHYTLLVVHAVLWAAITPTFARLRLFALNEFDARAWARFFLGGLLIANVLPVLSLAGLLKVPAVGGSPGILAGAALGLTPAVFPRLAHAALASNVPLRKFYSPSEAKGVLVSWDKQWAGNLCGEWDGKEWPDIPVFGDASAAMPRPAICGLRSPSLPFRW